MSLLTIPTIECDTEADVEQKFIYPLLVHPSFLDIPPKAILTKKSLGAFRFTDKTALPKNYVPDYVLFFLGLPICVIEAKQPDVESDTAIREARQYAQVLNQNFPSGINPVQLCVGCNGREITVGRADTNATRKFSTSDLVVGSKLVEELRDWMGVRRLAEAAARSKLSLSTGTFVAPKAFLDSQIFVDRVRQNALAPYLHPLHEMFFRAEDPEKIQLILDKAYVDTRELREYDNVLNSLLTRERIRQIEAKALRKLKHPSRSRKLRSFLDN